MNKKTIGGFSQLGGNAGFGLFGGNGGFVYNSGGSPEPLTVVVSSLWNNVDGLFYVSIVFSRAVYEFTLPDITVTNGSAEYLNTEDNITFMSYVMPDALGDLDISIGEGVCFAVDDNGPNSASNILEILIDDTWEYLSNPELTHIYYDFRELSGINNDTIEATDPGIRDLSGNERNGARINAPKIRTIGAIDATQRGIVALKGNLTGAISIGGTGSTFFNNLFAVNFKIQSNDGIPSTNWYICGSNDGSNVGLKIYISTTGRLKIEYQTFVWTSTNAVFSDGQTSIADFFINFDFTNDVLTVKQNNVAVPGSFTTGNISSVNPASYACTANFYIGTNNNNGTADSNPNNSSVYYFVITNNQGTTSTIRSYIEAKKPCVELISTLEDATYLKSPHDVVISSDGTKAYVSGKGDPVLTNVDGSFAIVNISVPGLPVISGGYANQGDQKDGETVLELSATRVLHFVNNATLLFDVSEPTAPIMIRNVSNATGVVNGAVQSGDYVFGANKGGFIDVFNVSVIDSFTLVGSYDSGSLDGMIGPHDIAMTTDGEHIVFCSKTIGAEVAIIKVFNAGALIPIASWTPLCTINSSSNPNLITANRIGVNQETITLHMLSSGGGGDNVATYDITDLSAPVFSGQFSLTNLLTTLGGSAGGGWYRDKYRLTANGVGLRLLDVVSNPSNIIQDGAYFNAVTFALGSNTNFHDCEQFVINQQTFVIMSCQDNGIAIFKINRI